MSFALASLAGLGLTAGFAARTRGARTATVLSIFLSIHVLVSVAVYPLFGAAGPVLWALQLATLVSVASLLSPGLRSLPWRTLVDWPASAFLAGTFLAIPWALIRIGPWEPWGIAIPYALAAIGLVQSLTARREQVTLDLRTPSEGPLARDNAALTRSRTAPELDSLPVRIAQITDPVSYTHLTLPTKCWV